MAHEIDPKHLDRRTSPRYLQRGNLDAKEYEKYLKALPDLADKCEPVTSEQPGGRKPDSHAE
jgi:hypothetical protein